MWRRIGTDAYEEALELAAIIDGVVRWQLQPCRRVVGGWVHCETHERVTLRPTHWRPAEETCRCFAQRSGVRSIAAATIRAAE